jgi:WD40 repeat protein
MVHDDDDMPSALALEDGPGGSGGSGGGHTFYVTNRAGELYHLDTRCKGAKVGSVHAHDKKVPAVSLQAGGAAVLTASTDTTVKIWDARKLPRHVPSGARAAAKGMEPVTVLAHPQAVTGAAWSPTGRYLATVCNDNKVRVWEAPAAGGAASSSSSSSSAAGYGTPSGPASGSLYHNNHTGRWLAPFKVSWDPASEGTVVVGNMDRAIDLLAVSPGGQLTQAGALKNELLTAVPTQVAVHPTLYAAVGGTASGRVHMFM